jgi:hypothetical protein
MRNIVFAIVFGFVAIGAMAAQPSLTKGGVIRIADTKAKSTGHDLRHYQRWPIHYERGEGLWWVNYRRDSGKYTEFSIQVEDKSKKAWLVLPNVIPSEAEESLTIVWPWFAQKYPEMFRLRST